MNIIYKWCVQVSNVKYILFTCLYLPFVDMTFSPSDNSENDTTTKLVILDIFAPSPLIFTLCVLSILSEGIASPI